MASIPVFSPIVNIKTKRQALNLKPLLRSRASSSTSFSIQRRLNSGTAVSNFASSASEFRGRVGFSRRKGKDSFLSFGVDESVVGEVGERDWSQILSALLPFVVVATSVAALSQPSTFTWLVSACPWFLLFLSVFLGF